MPLITKIKRDKYARDIAKDVKTKGEIYDEDVINQSIEFILATGFGERLFNPSFGSEMGNFLFEGMTTSKGETLLNSLIKSIKQWENRVTVLEAQCQMFIDYDNNALSLTIPYVINQRNIKSVFQKKIVF